MYIFFNPWIKSLTTTNNHEALLGKKLDTENNICDINQVISQIDQKIIIIYYWCFNICWLKIIATETWLSSRYWYWLTKKYARQIVNCYHKIFMIRFTLMWFSATEDTIFAYLYNSWYTFRESYAIVNQLSHKITFKNTWSIIMRLINEVVKYLANNYKFLS